MRLLLASVVVLAACSQPAAPVRESTPPAQTDRQPAQAQTPEVCPDQGLVPLASTRANYSLAAEYSRNAEHAENGAARRDAYCAAVVYLEGLLAHDPTFTGGAPDDRNYRRLASAYEFLSALDPDGPRALLDRAVALRDDALAVRGGLGLDVDRRAHDLREATFFQTHAAAYEDASRREFEAASRAFAAAPADVHDAYLRRLVELSAEWTEDPLERADYLSGLAVHVDDAEYRAYVESLIETLRYVPPAAGDALTGWIAAYGEGAYATCEPRADVQRLFSASRTLPDAVREAGGDPQAILDALLDCVVDERTELTAENRFALAIRSWRRGDAALAEERFEQAIRDAESNRQRARFAYRRARLGYGDAEVLYRQTVAYDPAHAGARFALAGLKAQRIGQPQGARQRAVYWCLADDFSAVAGLGDVAVSDLARRQARTYEEAAPRREEYIFSTDWRPGDTVRVTSGSVTCTTRVR